MLSAEAFYGKVIDIGGKRVNKRGSFRPPVRQGLSWEYANIDKTTCPDYHCSADQVPVPDETYDIVLMTEVLEHLHNPGAALVESYRLLKNGGKLVASMPFLFPVHSDPHDYQRWAPERIRMECVEAGFSEIDIEPMGGFFAVIMDITRIALNTPLNPYCPLQTLVRRALIRVLIPISYKIFLWLDKRFVNVKQQITTGYAIRALKKS